MTFNCSFIDINNFLMMICIDPASVFHVIMSAIHYRMHVMYASRLKHFIGDLVAGLTVGLTVIPQGMAYAQVAELPPQVTLAVNSLTVL